MRRLDDDGRPWQPGPNAVICSAHFTGDDFYTQWSRKLVKPDAVPTVFSFKSPVRKRKVPKQRQSPSAAEAETTSSSTASSSVRTTSVCETSATTEISQGHVASTSATAFHSYAVASPTKLKNTTKCCDCAYNKKLVLYGTLGAVSGGYKARCQICLNSSDNSVCYQTMPMNYWMRTATSLWTYFVRTNMMAILKPKSNLPQLCITIVQLLTHMFAVNLRKCHTQEQFADGCHRSVHVLV